MAHVSFLVNQIRDPFFSVRIGQAAWSRRLPPLSFDTPPMAVGLLLARVLRRFRRHEA